MANVDIPISGQSPLQPRESELEIVEGGQVLQQSGLYFRHFQHGASVPQSTGLHENHSSLFSSTSSISGENGISRARNCGRACNTGESAGVRYKREIFTSCDRHVPETSVIIANRNSGVSFSCEKNGLANRTKKTRCVDWNSAFVVSLLVLYFLATFMTVKGFAVWGRDFTLSKDAYSAIHATCVNVHGELRRNSDGKTIAIEFIIEKDIVAAWYFLFATKYIIIRSVYRKDPFILHNYFHRQKFSVGCLLTTCILLQTVNAIFLTAFKLLDQVATPIQIIWTARYLVCILWFITFLFDSLYFGIPRIPSSVVTYLTTKAQQSDSMGTDALRSLQESSHKKRDVHSGVKKRHGVLHPLVEERSVSHKAYNTSNASNTCKEEEESDFSLTGTSAALHREMEFSERDHARQLHFSRGLSYIVDVQEQDCEDGTAEENVRTECHKRQLGQVFDESVGGVMILSSPCMLKAGSDSILENHGLDDRVLRISGGACDARAPAQRSTPHHPCHGLHERNVTMSAYDPSNQSLHLQSGLPRMSSTDCNLSASFRGKVPTSRYLAEAQGRDFLEVEKNLFESNVKLEQRYTCFRDIERCKWAVQHAYLMSFLAVLIYFLASLFFLWKSQPLNPTYRVPSETWDSWTSAVLISCSTLNCFFICWMMCYRKESVRTLGKSIDGRNGETDMHFAGKAVGFT